MRESNAFLFVVQLKQTPAEYKPPSAFGEFIVFKKRLVCFDYLIRVNIFRPHLSLKVCSDFFTVFAKRHQLRIAAYLTARWTTSSTDDLSATVFAPFHALTRT